MGRAGERSDRAGSSRGGAEGIGTEAEHPAGRRVALEPVGAVVAVVLAMAAAVAVAEVLRTAGERRR